MIKVSVFYPAGEGKTFNMDYYLNTHMPLVAKLSGAALKGTSVDAGLSGDTPGAPAPYTAIGHLYFNSLEEFGQSFVPNINEIVADVPKYTNIQTVVQISQVMT